jgi:hypothetical protein
MTPRRAALLLAITLVLEWGAFRWRHRDVLWLDTPAAVQADTVEARAAAEAALARPSLSRRHAEAVIRVTARADMRDLHVRALGRLVVDHPAGPEILLRHAEALRQVGRLEEAARAYRRVLHER